MNINSLVIKGFKNLADFKLQIKNNKTTVLIGNNGTGKSNILEAVSAIFAGLYDNTKIPEFKFLLNYEINNKSITINNLNANISYRVNSDTIDKLLEEHLPSQIIASYSGEDNRLWSEYYEPFYKKYVDSMRGAGLPRQPLLYINKYYWNIALLTFFFYDFSIFPDIGDFCKKTLGIEEIDNITFTFDTKKLNSWAANPIVSFVKTINPSNKTEITITLKELKKKLEYIGTEIDIFKYLSAAYMPKNDKLITNIKIHFNGCLTTDVLGEGEKKLILIKLILEVIGDQNSLILLDEPDSHIHVSRKRELQEQLDSYKNRNNIITTHSPTLTHCFDDKQIRMLIRKEDNTIKIYDMSKKDSIKSLTDGIWSYQEQTIFLSTNKDILLVEGKTDRQYIETALKKLQKQYAELSFEIFPFNGAQNLIEIIDRFEPKKGQTIIALLDRDKAGFDAVKEIFPDETIDKETFNYSKKGNIYVAMLPCKKYYRGNKDSFLIEDYFTLTKIKTFVFPKDCKSFATVGNKDNIKKTLAKECSKFDKTKFIGFRKLFDLINEMKKSQSSK